MIKFKDEQGNFVTPCKDDYVLASDIKDRTVHDQVRKAFGEFCGLHECIGYFGASNLSCYCCNSVGVFWSQGIKDVAPHLRRIVPVLRTLFEAAKDAPDGTRFKTPEGEYTKTVDPATGSFWTLELRGRNIETCILSSTDFEIIPPGPRKRDVKTCSVLSGDGVFYPSDMREDFLDAAKLLGRLLQWEGAQIGKPGWVMVPKRGPVHATIQAPFYVTFETEGQCLAAYRAECPEMFDTPSLRG